jgi:hypothetical protein
LQLDNYKKLACIPFILGCSICWFKISMKAEN